MRDLTDKEIEIEQQRIDKEEKLEKLEKFEQRIEDIMRPIICRPLDRIDRIDLEATIEEIEWELRCLE